MGFTAAELGAAQPATQCMNQVLKWSIISGLIGVFGVTSVLVGLHLSGNLVSEKVNSGGKSAAHGVKFPEKTLDSAANFLVPALVASSDKVKDGVSDVVDTVKDATGSIGDVIADAGDVVADVGDGLEDVSDVIGDGVADVLGDGASDVLDGISDVIDAPDLGDIGDGIQDVAGDIKDAAADLVDKAGDIVGDVDLDPDIGDIGEGLGEIGEGISEVGEALGEQVGELGEGVAELGEDLAEGLGSLSDGLGDLGDDGNMAALMFASVLGNNFNQPRRTITSRGGNPYSALPIARPPRLLPQAAQDAAATNLGLLMLAMSDDMDDWGDGLELGDDLDFDW